MVGFLKFSHSVSTASPCSAPYPKWKRVWSGVTRFLCELVALTYLILHPLICKMLGYIRRFPGFLLTKTLGARAGRWLTDAAGGAVRCCAHRSSFTQIAKGGVCTERMGGEPIPSSRQVSVGQASQGGSKNSSSLDSSSPPAAPPPHPPPQEPNCVSQS